MSRKYGQRGYQEGDRERPARPSAPAPRGPREDRLRPTRPQGRGLGAPGRQVFRCAACGAEQRAPGAEDLAAACAACGADLHTCSHCRYFDTSARFECRHPAEVAVRVAKKAAANDCGLFEPRATVEHAAGEAKPDDARSAFDSLFEGL